MSLRQFAFPIACLAIALSSCSSLKTANSASLHEEAGREQLESPEVKIEFPGDYWFHRLRPKSTLNYNQRFVNSLKSSSSPKLLYAAHTMIQPYCQSVGMLYGSDSESLPSRITESLKSNGMKARNMKTSAVEIKRQRCTRLEYEIYDPTLKITTAHMEYLVPLNGKSLRLAFWTTESNKDWFEQETMTIAATVTGVDE